MPVLLKLSQAFYEKLGDQVTNELVDWFNAVEEYRRRSVDELNRLRFDATIERRQAESNARIDRHFAELSARIERRFDSIDMHLARLETRLSR